MSVLIIQSHDIFIHHHDLPHEHEEAAHHDSEEHNAFSLVDLDEDFILQNKIDIYNTFIATFCPIVIETILIEPTQINLLVIKNEYPPPKPQLLIESLRGPPFISFC